jgi:outer membrane immunogenic protein
MRRLGPGLVAVALAAGFAAPAHAADMAPAPSYYPPAAAAVMPPALYDWTGFYLGGNLGAGLVDDNFSQLATTATTVNLFGSTRVSEAGFIGGAQMGVNYEFAPVVVGVEASWTDSAITGSSTSLSTTGTVAAVQERETSAPVWIAAATGRIGYAANTVLFYAKGGAAWMNVQYTQDTLVFGGALASTQVLSDTRTGFTAGVGVEYGMTENLSAKLEYDFYDFGTKNYNAFAQTPVSIDSNLHAIIVGLNYRFNWAGGWH